MREFARTRDQQLKEHLVERFLPLARQLASRYRGRGEPMEDLVQIASVGLVNAISRFDPERGFSFASFAVPTILGELRHHFRDRGWSVHLDRGLKERHATVARAIGELSKRLGRSPSMAEISERVEMCEEDVLEAIDAGNAHHALSIDAGAPEGDDGDRPPIVESLGEGEPGYEAVDYGEAIAPVIAEPRGATGRSSTCGCSTTGPRPRSRTRSASRRCRCRGSCERLWRGFGRASASRKWPDEHPTRLVSGWRNEYRRRAHGRHWIVVTLQFAGRRGPRDRGVDLAVRATNC